ncbi:hypothetical protein PSRE111525_12440 [Pseudomonas reidholzensis]
MALIDVVANLRIHSAGALADGDGDALAVGQGDDDRAAGDRCIDRCGVDDGAAFGDRRSGGQGYGGGVGDVANARGYGGVIGDQILVAATADTSDLSRDGCMALVHIVADRCVDCTGALADGDGNALAVGQGDHDGAAGDRRIDRRGVDDGAAFSDRRCGGQGDGGRVGDIGDAGRERALVRHQTFVIATADAGDVGGDGGMALVDVVADGCVDGSRALADGDGDALAVGQGDHDWATGDRSVDRCGVNDGTALGDRRCGGQGHGSGVGHVGNARRYRALACHQTFVIPTAHPSDLGRDCCMALVHVVADRRVDGARALADGNGDALAVGQGDHDRAAGGRRIDRGGVDDGAAFGDRRGGGEGDGGGVGHVGDARRYGAVIGNQVLVIAAAHASDLSRNGGMALVHIIADGCIHRARALADGDGDALTVGQGDHDWAASDGRVDRGGVDDGAALGDRRGGRQGHGGGVGDIGDARRSRALVRHQVFEITAADPGDVVGDGSMALVDVIADRRVDRPRTLADGDGDALAVGQGHHDGTAGDRCVDRGGVDDGAAFGHRRRGGQAHGSGVGDVGNARGYWALVHHQAFEIAAADPGDVVGDGSMALVDIVADRRVDRAGALADSYGDALAVGQGDHDWATGDGRIDRRGVDDGPALGNGRRGRQGDGGGVSHIGDTGSNCVLVRHQVFVIATACAGDAVGHRGMALIDVIADRCVDRPRALADSDGDALSVGQGDHDWAAGDRCIDRCGVDDGAALGDGRSSRQGDGGGVADIGDARGNRALVRDQILVAPAADPGDLGRDCGMALIDVVADWRVGGTGALAHGDGDALTVGQGDHDRVTGNRSTHRGRIDDDAAFNDRRCSGQGDGGGVTNIGDTGGNRALVRHQVFVIAAADAGDVGSDGRVALVHVVADWRVNGAGALADGNGDALAVGQCHHDRAAGDGCPDRRGVNDGAAFGNRRGGCQGDGRGVWNIGDTGGNRALVRHQVLVVAAANAGDVGCYRRMALIDVIADWRVGGTGALAHGDGDALTVGKGDHDRITGNRSTHRGRIDDDAAFSDRRCSGQGDGGGVTNIGDTGGNRALVRHQVFVIAAADAGDVGSDGRVALVHVVADRRVDGAGALAYGDGDALAVGQCHHDRAAGDWGVDRRGVNDGPALGDRRGGCQGDGGGVANIGDACGNRALVRHKVLVVTTADPGYLSRDCGMAVVSVVADWRVNGAGALADGNGDALAVGQCHHDRAAGDGCPDRCGVNDGAAFGNRRWSRQCDGRGVANIGDAGGNRTLVRHQVFVIAAADAGDVGSDGRVALVHVVADRRVDGAGALAHGDGDALAVGQGDHDRAAGDRCVDRCGVDDGAAFNDRRRSGQRHGGGVADIGDARGNRALVRDQILVAPAADPGDLGRNCGMALIDVVADWRVGGA